MYKKSNVSNEIILNLFEDKKEIFSSKNILEKLLSSNHNDFINKTFLVSNKIISKKDGSILFIESLDSLKNKIKFNENLRLYEISDDIISNLNGINFSKYDVEKYGNDYIFDKKKILENPILNVIYSNELLREFIDKPNDNIPFNFGIFLLNSKKRNSNVLGSSFYSIHGYNSFIDNIIPYKKFENIIISKSS